MDNYRNFQGTLRILERKGPFLFPVEIWLLNDSVNRNNWKFINLEQHRTKFAGTPILIAYINGGFGIGDGHNYRDEKDPVTGDPAPSFTGATAERIVGALSDDPNDIRLEIRGENTWIVGKGFLWAWYAKELVAKIGQDARQGREMSISIETLITKEHKEGDVDVEEEYVILGTTILGDHVMPAVADAHIAMLSALEDEFKTLKLKAASYREQEEKPQNKLGAVGGSVGFPPVAGNPEEDGQPKNNNKGVKRLMYWSKQQLKELQAKFGDDYNVLAAREDGGKVTVLLLRVADLAFLVYLMGEKDSVVDMEKAVARNARISVDLEEGDTLYADAYETIYFHAASLEEETKLLSADVKRLDGELKEAQGSLSAMRETENKRRVLAAKDKAKSTLDEFNANREHKVEEKVLEAVNADIEAGNYTNSVDADGAWIGDMAVKEKVLSLCAAAVMELDKASASRNNGAYIWDKLKTNSKAADNTVTGLLSRMNSK